jgi:hypothetical protein
VRKSAQSALQAALDSVGPAITATTSRLRALAADEVTVELGLVLGVEGGAIFAKGTAEAHLTVTLTWSRTAETIGPPEQEATVAVLDEVAVAGPVGVLVSERHILTCSRRWSICRTAGM